MCKGGGGGGGGVGGGGVRGVARACVHTTATVLLNLKAVVGQDIHSPAVHETIISTRIMQLFVQLTQQFDRENAG